MVRKRTTTSRKSIRVEHFERVRWRHQPRRPQAGQQRHLRGRQRRSAEPDGPRLRRHGQRGHRGPGSYGRGPSRGDQDLLGRSPERHHRPHRADGRPRVEQPLVVPERAAATEHRPRPRDAQGRRQHHRPVLRHRHPV